MFYNFLFHRRRYFTLIELLVVIAIIAVLLAILLPAITAVRQAAAKATSASQLHQIGIAINNYDAQTSKPLPPGTPRWNPGPSDTVGGNDGGVFFYILPYIERETLYTSAYQQYDETIYNWNVWVPSWPEITTIHHGPAYFAERISGDIKLYEGPADRNWQPNTSSVSYLANGELFDSIATVTPVLDSNGNPVNNPQWGQPETTTTYHQFTIGTIPDGSSNTVFFAEGYSGWCFVYQNHYDWSTWQSSTTEITRYAQWNLGPNSVNSQGWTGFVNDTVGAVFRLDPDGVSTFEVRPPEGQTWNWGNPVYDPNTGGTSNTYGYSYNCNALLPQANFPSGLLVCLGDGSVRTVHLNVSYDTWKAALTPEGNDAPGSDW